MTDPLALDPRTTALVIIDLQRGIIARQAAPHTAQQVVERSAAIGRKCNDVGALVVLVHVTFAQDGADRLTQPVDVAMMIPQGGLPADFAEFTEEIAALRSEVVITKRQWGAFHGTELDLQLRRRGITTIVLCGIATNFGVEQTAREAWQHGYGVVIPEDACTSVDAAMHRFACASLLPRVARVRSTADVLASFS
jgi:nicotinamidase-related amidase